MTITSSMETSAKCCGPLGQEELRQEEKRLQLTAEGRLEAHSRNKPRTVIPGRSQNVCTPWRQVWKEPRSSSSPACYGQWVGIHISLDWTNWATGADVKGWNTCKGIWTLYSTGRWKPVKNCKREEQNQFVFKRLFQLWQCRPVWISAFEPFSILF